MDGAPKSNTSVVDFVSKGKTTLLLLRTEKVQDAVFQSSLRNTLPAYALRYVAIMRCCFKSMRVHACGALLIQ